MRNPRSISIMVALATGLLLTVGNSLAQSDTTGYRDMMADIFSPACLNCHNSALSNRNGAPAGEDFDTYTLAAVNAATGNNRVQAGTMPPASTQITLTAAQMATFQDWVDQGTPLGTVTNFQDMTTQVFNPVCNNCHSTTASSRSGAPSDVNFNTYEAAKAKADRGNDRAQLGTMPLTGPLSSTQKATFQDWVWLDTPSGERVTFETLSDSLLQPALCLLCHDSNKSGTSRMGAPEGVDYDNYTVALASANITNNRVQTATASPHGPQSQSLKDMTFNWIYAGVPENDNPPGPACDLDGSGAVDITDVIWLIIFIRNNSYDQTYDFNGDSRLGIADVIGLLITIRSGKCSDGGSLLASAAGANNASQWLATLTGQDKAYLENQLALLDLSAEEQAAFRAALYGQGGRAALPRAFSMAQNRPNPFNPLTTISYTVPEGEGARVTIEVFDISGRLVALLSDQFREAGSYSVFWDGTDSRGSEVSSGVYFYRMRAGEYVQTRKMVLLK